MDLYRRRRQSGRLSWAPRVCLRYAHWTPLEADKRQADSEARPKGGDPGDRSLAGQQGRSKSRPLGRQHLNGSGAPVAGSQRRASVLVN